MGGWQLVGLLHEAGQTYLIKASNEALGAGQNIPIHSYVHGDMARNEVAGS